jgi:cell division protein FtsB
VRGRNRTTYQRRRIVAVVGIALLVCWIAAVFVLRGVEIRALRAELSRIRSEQQVAMAEQASLRGVLALKDDPEVIEDHARDRLGLVMPGEEKIIFDREE